MHVTFRENSEDCMQNATSTSIFIKPRKRFGVRTGIYEIVSFLQPIPPTLMRNAAISSFYRNESIHLDLVIVLKASLHFS
jgi:hypothetical protein